MTERIDETEASSTATVGGSNEAPPLAPPAMQSRKRWAPLAIASSVGLLLGGGIGAGVIAAATDPTRSDEYKSVTAELAVEKQHVDNWRAQAEKAASSAGAALASASEAGASAVQRQAELDQREAQVAARESAVAATEQRIAATSIGEGTWTVGVDVEPGVYRTKEPVSGQCYWGIYRSGTNGSDIIDNDIVTGGFPTVTLSTGQDFNNHGCGTFVKQ